ncbi:glycohydrolase toxin TNT-related protein [Persicobacter psychrovividus]|uniref:TNT domain-containing protein n=1 Tax=Persicobacter psychrovividus TaxID=387638 RepID=A0ABM7VKA7_9BACT|nr:hypothetical protein PEPS_37080 [Persicobacter psychrovividus]
MFKRIFGKKAETKKQSYAIDSESSNKKFSAELKEKIEQSRLQLMTHELFMHYWSDNLKEETENPEWQNQAVFFWKFKELFEKKSLPPNFQELQKKYFIVNGLPENVNVSAGQVMPWFGMPGGGTKYFFQTSEKQIPIDNLTKSNAVSYVEVIELSDSNSDLLTKTDECFFLMDTTMISFDSGKFYFGQEEIPFANAVEIGGLELIRMKK